MAVYGELGHEERIGIFYSRPHYSSNLLETLKKTTKKLIHRECNRKTPEYVVKVSTVQPQLSVSFRIYSYFLSTILVLSDRRGIINHDNDDRNHTICKTTPLTYLTSLSSWV